MPLDRQCQEFLNLSALAGRPPWNELGVQVSRDAFASMKAAFGSGPVMKSVDDRSFIGGTPDGTRSQSVSVRVYRPVVSNTDANSKLPAWILFHGGGWVLGDLDTHDPMARRLAASSQAVVVSVDYRRSPEHRHPIPIHDCYAATSAVIEHCIELGIDRDRIGLIGDSAGGHLAACVAMIAAEKLPGRIAQLALAYPVISPLLTTPSYEAYAEGYGLTRSTMKWFWGNYTGVDLAATGSPILKHADLLRADVSRLPPTHLITAQYDVLRDEGVRFAERLRQSGVRVTHREYPGMIHGFIHFAGLIEEGIHATLEMGKAFQTEPEY